MDEQILIDNLKYLVNKYLSERKDLVELAEQDTDSTKYILPIISSPKSLIFGLFL